MNFFAVIFLAVFAVAMATPVQVEVRQDFMDTILTMLKSFLCGQEQAEVVVEERFDLNMIINMLKMFIC